MLFNSIEFLIFFPVVTAGFFLLPQGLRWMWLLAASCYFYMAFLPIYILILLVTIVVDYTAALLIDRSQGRARRFWLILSIVVTCAVLFVFKYYNFFMQSAHTVAGLIGWNYPPSVLALLLPIGLSFHTFQSLSYVIEVYRGSQRPEKHFGIYSLYVMFYPQLVAGPIERPHHLLRQLREDHRFDLDRAICGVKRMAWGFFKKMVIADRLALFVSQAYGSVGDHSGATLAAATVFFAFQIYCDFSGYTDIALGAAQVMGFKLMENFNHPYTAHNLREFWRRWHISLSTWFRDYVFIPLGGNRGSRLLHYRNLLITFVISGLWHGANATYLVWGALHGALLVGGLATADAREAAARRAGLSRHPRLRRALGIMVTFVLVALAWVFFRAVSLADAGAVLTKIGSALIPFGADPGGPGWEMWHPAVLAASFPGLSASDFWIAVILIGVLIGVGRLERGGGPADFMGHRHGLVRWTVYYGLILGLLTLRVTGSEQFIYFQF